MDPKLRAFLASLMTGASPLALCSITGEGEGEGAGGAAPAGDDGAAAGDDDAGGADDAAAGEDSDAAAAGAADEGAEAGAEGAEGGEEEPTKPKRVPWYEKRIAKLAAENKALKERAPAGEDGGGAEAAPAPAGGGYVTDKGERLYTQAEVEAMSTSRAALADLNKRADNLFDAGKKAYAKTWDARINAAGAAFGQDLARRTDLFDLITDLPNGAQVYHELTGDLDGMEEVLALPPHKLGARLAQMSAELAKPKGPAVSKAPAPITPIDGDAGAGEADLAKVPMSEYAKSFEERRAKRYGA